MSATSEQMQQFIELRAENVSYAKIAKQLGVSKTTLIDWSKNCELEIENCRVKYLIVDEVDRFMRSTCQAPTFSDSLSFSSVDGFAAELVLSARCAHAQALVTNLGYYFCFMGAVGRDASEHIGSPCLNWQIRPF